MFDRYSVELENGKKFSLGNVPHKYDDSMTSEENKIASLKAQISALEEACSLVGEDIPAQKQLDLLSKTAGYYHDRLRFFGAILTNE